MRDELEVKNHAIANLETQISGVVAGNNDQVLTIAELENQLSGVISELKERDNAIANLKTELEARGDKQLNLFPPEPEPTPTPEPVTISPVTEPEPTPTPTPELKTKTKSKANPKAKSISVPGFDLASLIIPPGYKLGDSAELIEFVLEKFPNSELKNKGDITDAIRDRHGKAKGSENSRLFNFEQECGFKHLGKAGAKHKFLIPIA